MPKNQNDKAATFRAYRFRVPPDMRGPLVSYPDRESLGRSPGLKRSQSAFATVEIPESELKAYQELERAAAVIDSRLARWRSTGIESGQLGRDKDFNAITANLANSIATLTRLKSEKLS